MWKSQQAFPNRCGNPRFLWISTAVSFSTGRPISFFLVLFLSFVEKIPFQNAL
jgi:hypothetical protein